MSKQARVEVVTELAEDDSGFVLKLTFANGVKRQFGTGKDDALFNQFAAYGAKAKLLAAVNSVGDTDVSVEKVDALLEAFDEGKWSLQVEGLGKFSPLMHALSELKGISLDAAEVMVKAMSKSTQAKLRATERVASIIARVKAKDEKADADKLLDSLLVDEDGKADHSELAA